MITLKFGGTSMGSAQRILNSAHIITQRASQDRISVVVSAVAGVSNYLQESITSCESHIIDSSVFVEFITKTHTDIIMQLVKEVPSFQCEAVLAKLQPLFAEYERLLTAVFSFGECPLSIHCRIMGMGELLCAPIMEEVLRSQNADVLLLDSRNLIFAVGNQAEGEPDYEKTAKAFAPYREEHAQSEQIAHAQARILLLPGFICSWIPSKSDAAHNSQPKMGLLGRNGSDFSAAIVAVSLNALKLEIWTDVDGIYTADPRIVRDAILVDEMSYEEAMELSFFGSKVIHPKTLTPIAERGIETWSLNSLNLQAKGTRIVSQKIAEHKVTSSTGAVRGISCLKNTALVSVSGSGLKGKTGTAARIFSAVSRKSISILLITQSSSEYTISFCVNEDAADAVSEALQSEFELEIREKIINPIEIQRKRAIVSIVGDGMKQKRGVAGTFFTALASSDINIHAIAQGSSERSISAVITSDDGDTAVRTAHRFFFDTDQTIEIFIFGVGTVGSRLLNQIKHQKAELLAQKIDVQIKVIANSSQMLVNDTDIDLTTWKEALQVSATQSSLDEVFNIVRNTKPLNPVFVDCTATASLSERYLEILGAGMHIVTPNKRANSLDWNYYCQLRTIANTMRRRFLYETNVGAGLPVIDTLQNMFKSGDRLTGFSGIMSGSLSYIFGRLDENIPFSQAVLEAREKGFTEPDPRDDLSGLDVARKTLIIAREAGLPIELTDVRIAPLFPPFFDPSGTTEEFLQKLPQLDTYFTDLLCTLQKEGKVLRMAASIVDNACTVAVMHVGKDHPLYAIRGGENAFVFETKRYSPIPLVVRGYGAGAGVTAAGVFADILHTVSWNHLEKNTAL